MGCRRGRAVLAAKNPLRIRIPRPAQTSRRPTARYSAPLALRERRSSALSSRPEVENPPRYYRCKFGTTKCMVNMRRLHSAIPKCQRLDGAIGGSKRLIARKGAAQDPNRRAQEKRALIALLRETVNYARYPLAPRLDPLKAILAKLDPPPPQPEPRPPLPPSLTPTHGRGRRRR